MTDRKKCCFRGSYTVEAALLMGIIPAVLISVIYLGFLMHDRAFLQAAAHEMASVVSLHEEDDRDFSELADRLIAGRMLGTYGAAGSIWRGEKNVVVQYNGSFQIPGMIRMYFGEGEVQIQSRVELTTQSASKRIQKIRGLVKIARKVRDIGEGK